MFADYAFLIWEAERCARKVLGGLRNHQFSMSFAFRNAHCERPWLEKHPLRRSVAFRTRSFPKALGIRSIRSQCNPKVSSLEPSDPNALGFRTIRPEGRMPSEPSALNELGFRTVRSGGALSSEPSALNALGFRTIRSEGALPSEPSALNALGFRPIRSE